MVNPSIVQIISEKITLFFINNILNKAINQQRSIITKIFNPLKNHFITRLLFKEKQTERCSAFDKNQKLAQVNYNYTNKN